MKGSPTGSNARLCGALGAHVRMRRLSAAEKTDALQHFAITRIAANTVVNRADGKIADQDLSRARGTLQPSERRVSVPHSQKDHGSRDGCDVHRVRHMFQLVKD